MLSESNTYYPPGAYQSYLVRLWQEHAQASWRVSVQSVQSGEIVRFADLEALFAFLQTQTANSPTGDQEKQQ